MKTQFAASSSIATIVDYLLYQVLINNWFSPELSNIISATIGMTINFVLQKKYIFELRRSLKTTFGLSLLVSIVGIGISTTLVHLLSKYSSFSDNQYAIKAIATGIVFFYNFYLKRFAFEKRFLSDNLQ